MNFLKILKRFAFKIVDMSEVLSAGQCCAIFDASIYYFQTLLQLDSFSDI